MEELGVSKLTRLPALSKSSEQLDQLWRYSPGPGRAESDKMNVSFFAEVGEAQRQDRGRKKDVMEQVAKEPETVGQKNPQDQTQNQTQRKSLLKQHSEPREDASLGTRNSSRSTSPASSSSSRARVVSGSYGPVADVSMYSRPPSETSSNPPSPRGLEMGEREIKSSLSSPTQMKLPCETRPGSR